MQKIAEQPDKRSAERVGQSIIFTLLGWAFLYNVVVKEMSLVGAFFAIIDTITEDLVMGSLVTISVGVGIVLVFTITKLYTQIISRADSFRVLEQIVYDDLAEKKIRKVSNRLLNFQDEPDAKNVYPERPTSALVSFALLYVMSWTYLLLFSEALFFVSWSAGVDLQISQENIRLLPTLALAIPFSARVMAYFRYPYTQDYADFMPGAVFVLLLVGSLGVLFQSDDQQFFLLRVYAEPALFREFLRSGLTLAFIPVFSEAVFWMSEVFFISTEE